MSGRELESVTGWSARKRHLAYKEGGYAVMLCSQGTAVRPGEQYSGAHESRHDPRAHRRDGSVQDLRPHRSHQRSRGCQTAGDWSMSDSTEIDALKALLAEDYSELCAVGDTWDGFETIHEEVVETKRWHEIIQVITRGPSGQHYAWSWWCGKTEEQESEGPAGQRMVITLVHPVEETIVVTKWVKDA